MNENRLKCFCSDVKNVSRRHLFRVIIPAFSAFNIYSGIAKVTTALGPIYIASIINKMEGWDVEVIDENNYRRFGPVDKAGKPDHNALQRIRPADVVGLYGGLTSTIPRLYDIAKYYKAQRVKTIAGGQHFVDENIKEALYSFVDIIVIGEGEKTIKELLLSIENHAVLENINGIAFRRENEIVITSPREELEDFDKLPLPDFSLLRYAKIKVYPISWVRGCCMQCEFCTVKGKVRCPTPEYVLNQVASLLERLGARKFFLVDDLFGQNRMATLKLCRMLKEYQQTVRVKLSITVQIRLDKAKDAEMLKAMNEAGIVMVAIGFESPIPEELKAMNKKLKPEDMLAMTRTFHKAGFLIHGMFIFGYPIPGKSDFNVTAGERIRIFRKFIRKGRIDTVQILLPVPLPGTEMTRRLKEQNRLFARDCVGWEYYDGNFPLFVPDKPLTPEVMQASSQKIMGRFYRFWYMFLIGLNVLIFPAMLFPLYNIQIRWHRWYRYWRNDILRFAGWMIMKKWATEFKRSDFLTKLNRAKKRMGNIN